MKKKYAFLIIISILVFPAFSKGTKEAEPVSESVPAAEVADKGEEAEAVVSQPLNMDLKVKLNRAGFDTPKDTLPSIEFELFNLDGIQEKLSDYRGKVVFLNFWATWCGPCQSEMPAMESVYKELKDDGFVILAVDLGEDQAKVQSFADEYGLTFPIVLDETNAVGSMYNAQSIPTTYLLDREGNILGRSVGASPWEDEQYMTLFREILDM